MEWSPDGFVIKNTTSQLPSLLDSFEIDKEVTARRRDEDEIKPGADLISPVVILGKYLPHVLARVIEFWGRELDIDDYLGKLVLTERNNRAGFPKVIMDSLLEVWSDHRNRFRDSRDGQCQWSANDHLHKAFKKIEQEQAFVRKAGLTGAEAAILDQGLTDAANIQAINNELEKSAKPI